jgi:NADPH-dependent ferric siderophore reductase
LNQPITTRRRPTPRFHRVTVDDVAQLTPQMRRITFVGGDLASYPNDGPATHFKLLLPAGGGEVVLPTEGPDGLEWPEPRPILRTYTPRQIDTSARRLVVDFALHADGGPASRWAAAAAPGDQVVVTGARGAYRIDPAVDWTVLATDETALPAAATILEDAPAGARVLLFAEVADAGEQLSFDTAAELTTTWLHRAESRPGEGDGPGGDQMTAAIAAAELPDGPGTFWIGLEAATMRTLRRYLLQERQVARDALHCRAYWKRGVANHPDHDNGDDD